MSGQRENQSICFAQWGWENWHRVTGRASRGQLHSALALLFSACKKMQAPLQVHFSVLWDPSPAPPAVPSCRTDCGHLQCGQSNSWKNRLLGQKLHCPPQKRKEQEKKKYLQIYKFTPSPFQSSGCWNPWSVGRPLSLSPWLRWQSCSSANQGQGCATYSNDYRHNSLVPTLC